MLKPMAASLVGLGLFLSGASAALAQNGLLAPAGEDTILRFTKQATDRKSVV